MCSPTRTKTTTPCTERMPALLPEVLSSLTSTAERPVRCGKSVSCSCCRAFPSPSCISAACLAFCSNADCVMLDWRAYIRRRSRSATRLVPGARGPPARFPRRQLAPPQTGRRGRGFDSRQLLRRALGSLPSVSRIEHIHTIRFVSLVDVLHMRKTLLRPSPSFPPPSPSFALPRYI